MARTTILTIFAFLFFSCTVVAPVNTDDDDDTTVADDDDDTATDDDDDTTATDDDDDTIVADDDDNTVCNDCGGLDFLGQCDGTILSWCQDGCLQTSDCNSVGKYCRWVDDNTGYDCVATCEATLNIYNYCAETISLYDYDPSTASCGAAVANLNFGEYWYGTFDNDTPVAFCACDPSNNCYNDYQALVCGETASYYLCGN